MMQAKQKIPEKSDKKDQLGPSGALKTEEILSLLSKTDQGFIKESEISSNISKLFKKTTLSEVAKKPEKIEPIAKTINGIIITIGDSCILDRLRFLLL